jgi:hypothetical protein
LVRRTSAIRTLDEEIAREGIDNGFRTDHLGDAVRRWRRQKRHHESWAGNLAGRRRPR